MPNINPDLIIGDFDSHEKPTETNCECIVLPCEKDDTDTFFAAKEGLRRGFREFLLLGVVGARLDHTLGNVSILMYLQEKGAKGVILDDYSEMEIVSDEPAFIEDHWSYFSLLCLTGTAEGVTIQNAKYPLQDAVITSSYAYGVSNEVRPGKTAVVSVKQGILLLIKISPPSTNIRIKPCIIVTICTGTFISWTEKLPCVSAPNRKETNRIARGLNLDR